MNTPTLNRRRLLQGLLALPIAALPALLPGIGCAPRVSRLDHTAELLLTVTQQIPLPEPLAIGRAFLRIAPEETAASLMAQLFTPQFLSDNFLEAFQTNIREDFSQQQTAILDGWLVSQTEARFCALLQLLQPNT